MGLFAKFKEAWLKPMSFDSLNEGFYDDLEEALILADVGMDTAVDAVAQLKKRAYAKLLTHEEDVKNALRDILAEKLSVGDPALDLSTRPSVALIIGVNGVGKTTSIGKLAHRLKNEGKKVLLCAGDTFRAAAADQLEIWAERAGVDRKTARRYVAAAQAAGLTREAGDGALTDDLVGVDYYVPTDHGVEREIGPRVARLRSIVRAVASRRRPR